MDTPVDQPPSPGANKNAFNETWTFVGYQWDAGEKKLYHVMLDGEGVRRLYAKRITGTTVGGRYQVHIEREGDKIRATVDHYSYVGRHGDEPQVRAWQAESQAQLVARDAHALEKKEGRSKLADMTLGECARLYRKLPATRGRALLATCLSIITSRTAGGDDQ